MSRCAVFNGTAAVSLNGVFQKVVDSICAQTGWPVGHVYLPSFDKSKSELASLPVWHFENPKKHEMLRQVTRALRFPYGIGAPGRAYSLGAPLLISDVREDSMVLRGRLLLETGLQSVFEFPVKSGSKVLAVLEFFSEKGTKPGKALLERVQQTIESLAAEIEASRLVR